MWSTIIYKPRNHQDVNSNTAAVHSKQAGGSHVYIERCQILCGTDPDQEENTWMKRSDAFLLRKLMAIALLPSSV